MSSNLSQVANFSTVLGKYDGTYLSTSAANMDPSGIIGTSDLSLNTGGYLVNPNIFTTPAVGNGTGFSVTAWVYPQGAQPSNYTPIFDLCGNSSTAANVCTLCISGNSLTPVVVGNYLGNQVYVPSGSLTANTWNFVGYTVCCSGGTQMVQTVYVNASTTSITGGTYNALTVANTYIGYGTGSYALALNGKVDDYRYYGRVLTPMEMRVLYGFSYGKAGVTPLVPTLGTVTASSATTSSVTFTISNGGTYSYLVVNRYLYGVLAATQTVNMSALTPSGNGYTWTDTGLSGLITAYTYTFTPAILGTFGVASASVSPSNINPFSITSITSTITGYTGNQLGSLSGNLASGNGIIGGTSVTNGITYQVYAFGQVSTTGTYTLTYSCAVGSYVYVLAVGGGGGAGTLAGGGGGGGGVVMNPVYLPAGTGQTVSISIGAGGSGTTGQSGAGPATAGYNTTVTLGGTTLTAYGGGVGGANSSGTGQGGSTSSSGGVGGSVGGNGYSGPSTYITSNTYNYNYTSTGGVTLTNATSGSGGGGAGVQGGNSGINGLNSGGGNGGNGVQCFLPGISSFAPGGTAYGTYYWGGGGGGGGITVPGGNGGLGGGGAGGNGGAGPAVNGANGIGGGSALNVGGSSGAVASTALSGSGGANTGGGGGGAWNPTGACGSGGSGIVIIAFPQSPVFTNAQAVLPANLYTSGQYNDVLSNDSFGNTKLATLSSAAYQSAKGAFSCKLVNYNYFGPVMTLRYSTDTCGNYTANFYADVCGNLGTGYLGTGEPVVAWLAANNANTSYAYVTKWYDQAMDICFNSATQYALGSQPVYEVATGVINFGYTTGYTPGTNLPAWTANTGNAWLSLPNGDLPYNNSNYTYTVRLANSANVVDGGIISGGTTSNNNAYLLLTNDATNCVVHSWYGSNAIRASSAFNANNVITSTYNGTTMLIYMNGSNLGNFNPSGSRTQPSGPNYIGSFLNVSANYLNSQMYNLYIYSTVLTGPGTTPTTEQAIVEATPYAAPLAAPTVFPIAASTVSQTVTVTWTAIPSVATYTFYVSNVAVATVANTGGTLATYQLTNLATNLQPYVVTMNGYSSSGVLTYTGQGINALSAITGVTGGSITSSGFTVTWSGGTAVGTTTAYSYTVKLVSNSSVVSGYTTSGTNPTVFTGLAASTAYNVTVTATNPLGSVLGTIASISTPSASILPSSVTTNGNPVRFYPFWNNVSDYPDGITGTQNIISFNAAGSGNSAAYVTGTSYKAGISGSLYTRVSGGSVTLPTSGISSNIMSTGFTVGGWWYPTTSITTFFDLVLNTSGRIKVWQGGSIDVANTNFSVSAITLNAWTFICIRGIGGNKATLTINTTNTVNSTNLTTTANSVTTHTFNCDGTAYASENGNNYINNYFYFNRVLSDAEVTAMYNL